MHMSWMNHRNKSNIMGSFLKKILLPFQSVMANRVGTRKILIPTTFIFFSSKNVTRQDLVSVS